MLVKLTRGYSAQVDDEDAALIVPYSWHAFVKQGGRPYARALIGGRLVLLHRFLLGLTNPQEQVDHKDGDSLNCSRSNLRLATNAQNLRNRGATAGRRFKCVYWDCERSMWAVSIKHDGRQRHLGRFKDEIEAVRVADAAILRLHGEFARPNLAAAEG